MLTIITVIKYIMNNIIIPELGPLDTYTLIDYLDDTSFHINSYLLRKLNPSKSRDYIINKYKAIITNSNALDKFILTSQGCGITDTDFKNLVGNSIFLDKNKDVNEIPINIEDNTLFIGCLRMHRENYNEELKRLVNCFITKRVKTLYLYIDTMMLYHETTDYAVILRLFNNYTLRKICVVDLEDTGLYNVERYRLLYVFDIKETESIEYCINVPIEKHKGLQEHTIEVTNKTLYRELGFAVMYRSIEAYLKYRDLQRLPPYEKIPIRRIKLRCIARALNWSHTKTGNNTRKVKGVFINIFRKIIYYFNVYINKKKFNLLDCIVFKNFKIISKDDILPIGYYNMKDIIQATFLEEDTDFCLMTIESDSGILKGKSKHPPTCYRKIKAYYIGYIEDTNSPEFIKFKKLYPDKKIRYEMYIKYLNEQLYDICSNVGRKILRKDIRKIFDSNQETYIRKYIYYVLPTI